MTLAELLVAGAVTASLGSSVVLLMSPADALVRGEQEALDTEQRLRVVVDALMRDVMAASELRAAGDALTVVIRDADGVTTATRTYSLKRAAQQVVESDGGIDLPMVDHVSDLAFESLAPLCVRVTVVVAPASPLPGRPPASRRVQLAIAARARPK